VARKQAKESPRLFYRVGFIGWPVEDEELGASYPDVAFTHGQVEITWASRVLKEIAESTYTSVEKLQRVLVRDCAEINNLDHHAVGLGVGILACMQYE